MERTASFSTSRPLQNSPDFGDNPESIPGISMTYIKQDFQLQPAQSEDSASVPPSLPPVSDINEPDEQGFPWIVQAARDGNEELVRKLLASGADIHATQRATNRNALAEASLQGHQSIVDLLLQEGSKVDSTDAEGNTALHHACLKGHLAVAKSLLNEGAPVNASGPDGQSALHLAMQKPYPNVAMLLIQSRADVNTRDASFRTPLHLSASQGNVAMCSYLLNEGAQIDNREVSNFGSLIIFTLSVPKSSRYYDMTTNR